MRIDRDYWIPIHKSRANTESTFGTGGKKKIWSPWPNPGGREMKCWPGCRFKFIEQRYFTFAVKIVAIPSRKPALSLAGSVCGPSRDVYIAGFTFEDWSIIDSRHSGRIEWIRKFYSLVVVVVVVRKEYGFPYRGCFFDRVSKGERGSRDSAEAVEIVWRDAHSCLKRNLGRVFNSVPKLWSTICLLCYEIDECVCVFFIRLLHTVIFLGLRSLMVKVE